MSIVIFVIVLFALVLVHEFGHFIVAKLTGMRVDEFGIGFPPKVAGVKKGETEYTLNALPIGGFVKIFGEDGLGEDGSNEAQNRDLERSFTAKNKWAQAAVLIAGVTMNVLFAWFLFTTAFVVGVETAVEEHEATSAARLVVTDVLADSPAARGLLPRGASIESVQASNEKLDVVSPSAFSDFVATRNGEIIQVGYRLRGELVYTELSPEANVIPNEPERAAVGVMLTMVDTISEPLHVAIYEGGVKTIVTLRDIAVGLYGLLRDAILFRADLSQVAGPVGIVGLVGEASAFGFTALLLFTAFISLNLAIINLLPFPALDGGRLVFVAIEAVKGSAINPRVASVLNTVGFALLILLMVAVTWNDIAKII